MAEENLEKWVQEKLENGVSRKRLKKVLQNSGHDPSIVDEAESPFESEPENVENKFEKESKPQNSQGENETESSSEENKISGSKNLDLSKHQEKSSFDFSKLKPSVNLPSISKPDFDLSMPEIPEFSFKKPEKPDFKVPWRLLVVVLIVGVAFYGGTKAFNSEPEVKQPETVEEQTEFDGCPDIGVRIASASKSMFEVTVDAKVSRGPENVIVELYNNDNLVNVKESRFNGVKQFKFTGETGDTVILRPVGCYSVRDTVSLG